jgi:hypothetical protein
MRAVAGSKEAPVRIASSRDTFLESVCLTVHRVSVELERKIAPASEIKSHLPRWKISHPQAIAKPHFTFLVNYRVRDSTCDLSLNVLRARPHSGTLN